MQCRLRIIGGLKRKERRKKGRVKRPSKRVGE
jgi:hypothetical protein